MIASGQFEVNLTPLETDLGGRKGLDLGRMALEKTYRGELEAVSVGEMLSVVPQVEGSAGYVAVELVEGSLHGRQGSFALQHFGVMAGGSERLILEVIPDSGTGELLGLAGTMEIQVAAGQHSYQFDYEVEE